MPDLLPLILSVYKSIIKKKKSLLNYTLLFSWLNSTISVCVDLTQALYISKTYCHKTDTVAVTQLKNRL